MNIPIEMFIHGDACEPMLQVALRNKFQRNLNENTTPFIQENAIGNVFY